MTSPNPFYGNRLCENIKESSPVLRKYISNRKELIHGFFSSLLIRLLHSVGISVCFYDCSGSYFQGSKESTWHRDGKEIRRRHTGFSVSFYQFKS